MSLLSRYNALCQRRFVGILMIPLTIVALFLPMFAFVLLEKLYDRTH